MNPPQKKEVGGGKKNKNPPQGRGNKNKSLPLREGFREGYFRFCERRI
ncbi:hypothetical protein ACWIUD_03330 [Helicobacter sp. 23-1044]